MRHRLPAPVFLAITAYCLWSSADLIAAWKGGIWERYSWILFLLWILPVILYWTIPALYSDRTKPDNTTLMITALICTMVGNIGSLNFITYIGLALAVASLLPWTPWLIPWIATSITWMPVFNWIAIRSGLERIIPLGIGICLFGTVWVIYFCGIVKKGVE